MWLREVDQYYCLNEQNRVEQLRYLRNDKNSRSNAIVYGPPHILADPTVSKRPGTSYQIEIYFAVVSHLYLLVFFCESCWNLVTVFNKENA